MSLNLRQKLILATFTELKKNSDQIWITLKSYRPFNWITSQNHVRFSKNGDCDIRWLYFELHDALSVTQLIDNEMSVFQDTDIGILKQNSKKWPVFKHWSKKNEMPTWIDWNLPVFQHYILLKNTVLPDTIILPLIHA